MTPDEIRAALNAAMNAPPCVICDGPVVVRIPRGGATVDTMVMHAVGCPLAA